MAAVGTAVAGRPTCAKRPAQISARCSSDGADGGRWAGAVADIYPASRPGGWRNREAFDHALVRVCEESGAHLADGAPSLISPYNQTEVHARRKERRTRHLVTQHAALRDSATLPCLANPRLQADSPSQGPLTECFIRAISPQTAARPRDQHRVDGFAGPVLRIGPQMGVGVEGLGGAGVPPVGLAPSSTIPRVGSEGWRRSLAAVPRVSRS
jgi:hypothetical protein